MISREVVKLPSAKYCYPLIYVVKRATCFLREKTVQQTKLSHFCKKKVAKNEVHRLFGLLNVDVHRVISYPFWGF